MTESITDLLLEFAKAAAGIGLILGGWLAVQAAWRRAFPGATPEGEDVLADRLECGDCERLEACELASHKP